MANITRAGEPIAKGLTGTLIREKSGDFAPEQPGCGMGGSGAKTN